MKRSHIFIISLLFGALFTSCYTNEIVEPSTPEGGSGNNDPYKELGVDSITEKSTARLTYAPYTKDFDAEVQYIDNENALDYFQDEMLLSGAIPEDKIPHDGDVLIIQPCDKVPFGLFSQVTSVQNLGSDYAVGLIPADFDYAFEDCDVDIQLNAETLRSKTYIRESRDQRDTKDMSRAGGNILTDAASYVKLDISDHKVVVSTKDLVKKDEEDEGKQKSLLEKLTFSGSLEWGAKTAKVRILKNSRREYMADIDLAPFIKYGFNLKYAEEIAKIEYDKTVFSTYLGPFMVGQVPVCLRFDVDFKLLAKSQFEVGMGWSREDVFEFKYRINGDTDSDPVFRHSTREEPFTFTSLSLNGEAGFGMVFRTYVGIGVKGGNTGIAFDAEYSNTLSGKVDLIEDGALKLNTKVKHNHAIYFKPYLTFDASLMFNDKKFRQWMKEHPLFNILIWGKETDQMPVFPQFDDIAGNRAPKAKSATVSWYENQPFLVDALGVKIGMRLLDENHNPLQKSDGHLEASSGRLGQKRYTAFFDNLDPDKKYYIQPYAEPLLFKGLTHYGDIFPLGTSGNALTSISSDDGVAYRISYNGNGKIKGLTNYLYTNDGTGEPTRPVETQYWYDPTFSIKNSSWDWYYSNDPENPKSGYWVEDFVVMSSIKLNEAGFIERCNLMDNEDIGNASFYYDNDGHITTIRSHYPGETDAATFKWDSNGNLTEMISMEDGVLDARMTFTYDKDLKKNVNYQRLWPLVMASFFDWLAFPGLIGYGPSNLPIKFSMEQIDEDGHKDIQSYNLEYKMNANNCIDYEIIDVNIDIIKMRYGYRQINSDGSITSSPVPASRRAASTDILKKLRSNKILHRSRH